MVRVVVPFATFKPTDVIIGESSELRTRQVTRGFLCRSRRAIGVVTVVFDRMKSPRRLPAFSCVGVDLIVEVLGIIPVIVFGFPLIITRIKRVECVCGHGGPSRVGQRNNAVCSWFVSPDS